MTKTLNTVEEALEFFEHIISNPNETPKKIIFEGELKQLEIEIDGPSFHGDLTGELARGLAEFQDEIYRAAAFSINGAQGRHGRLTAAQKQSVELTINVNKGCTLVKIDMGKFSDGLFKLLGDMSNTQLTVLVGIATVTLVIGWLGKAWIGEHFKTKRENEAGVQESARMGAAVGSNVEIVDRFAKLLAVSPATERFGEASANGVRAIAARATGATSIKFGRTELDEEALENLNKRAPRSSAEQINEIGNFNILHVDGSATPFKLTVMGDAIPGEFTLEFDETEFSLEQVNAVWKAFRSRATVELEIKAVQLHDKVKGAVLTDILIDLFAPSAAAGQSAGPV